MCSAPDNEYDWPKPITVNYTFACEGFKGEELS